MEMMKDSGIPWIKEIPINWNTNRGKHILTLLNRPVKETDGVVTCFRDGEVTLRKNRRESGFTNSIKEIGYQGVEPNDLVVHGMDGFAGSIGISDSRGKMSPIINVMDCSQNKRYIMYYLRNLAYMDVFLALSTGIRERSCDLRWNKLSTLSFVLPPLDEQQAIADYLDEKCSKIDEIIAEATASIEEYKELKQAVIFEAVTKGLDKNVPMKDSGIDGWGYVPDTWKIVKMKNMINQVSSGLSAITSDNASDESGFYVLRTSAVSTGEFKFDEVKSVLKNAIDRLVCPVEKDTIVMSRMNTAKMVGYCAYIDKDYNNYYLPDKLWKIEMRSMIMPKYAWYLINSNACHNHFASIATGTSASMINITISDLKSLIVAVPDAEYQKIILNYLDVRVEIINALISEKQSLIEDLQAYKKSFIYEVVTGKRRVV